MKKFNIGDKVIAKRNYYIGRKNCVGEKGKIIYVSGGCICIEFEKDVGGHSGNHPEFKGKNGHCWWFDKLSSENLFDILNKSTQKLIITVNGAETLARLYEGNKVIKSATAKCSPDDTFDFEKGAKLAIDRLFGKNEKKAPQYYNGKVVCVSKRTSAAAYTVGKIYEFKDGRVKIDNNAIIPSDDKDAVTSVGDWNSRDYLWARFIPLVEG